MDATLARIIAIAREHGVTTIRESQSAMEAALIWKGRKSAFGATGRIASNTASPPTICWA
jgi:glycolate oxidase